MEKNFVTKNGFDNLLAQLSDKESRLKQILVEKAIAYEVSGDGWHDNPGWIQIGQQEERLTKEISLLKKTIVNANVIEILTRRTDSVQLGSIVKIEQVLGKQNRSMILEVVGTGESDLQQKRIAYDSPVGQAILGAKAGDEIIYNAPAGQMKILVIELLLNF